MKDYRKLFKEFINQSPPENLYHATFDAYMDSIKEHGLNPTKSVKNWADSNDVIYLATDPDIAEDYAETSEEVSDEVYDTGIVVLKIPVSGLDISKLQSDTNVRNDDEPTSYEYHGIIPWSKIEV